ncbi:MAG: hypothetical protein AAF578_08510 [Pseudomonadota bacterium]
MVMGLFKRKTKSKERRSPTLNTESMTSVQLLRRQMLLWTDERLDQQHQVFLRGVRDVIDQKTDWRESEVGPNLISAHFNKKIWAIKRAFEGASAEAFGSQLSEMISLYRLGVESSERFLKATGDRRQYIGSVIDVAAYGFVCQIVGREADADFFLDLYSTNKETRICSDNALDPEIGLLMDLMIAMRHQGISAVDSLSDSDFGSYSEFVDRLARNDIDVPWLDGFLSERVEHGAWVHLKDEGGENSLLFHRHIFSALFPVEVLGPLSIYASLTEKSYVIAEPFSRYLFEGRPWASARSDDYTDIDDFISNLPG